MIVIQKLCHGQSTYTSFWHFFSYLTPPICARTLCITPPKLMRE
uniref:Uncharacterized protein n=1 Tax=Lepeophtheirus salmonis TaxID=72036 RepID=A0A0K2T778_LEPSM